MWQKCPVCNGTGLDISLHSSSKCPTCQSMRIISEVTGLPPASVPPKPHTYTGTDFRDAPMESQDEYFGRK